MNARKKEIVMQNLAADFRQFGLAEDITENEYYLTVGEDASVPRRHIKHTWGNFARARSAVFARYPELKVPHVKPVAKKKEKPAEEPVAKPSGLEALAKASAKKGDKDE